MHISISLSADGSKDLPVLSYPQICFAVDDFDAAFEDVVGECHVIMPRHRMWM